MTTGQLIKTARKKAGMTQAELAQRLDIPFQSVSQWERDIRNPKMETLEKIADALHINVFALISDDARNAFFAGFNRAIHTKRFLEAKSDDEAEAAEDDVLSLLQYFDELDAYEQERAVACVRAMTGRPFIIGQKVQPTEELITAFYQLNPDGQQKAVERVEELTEIPKYQKDPTPPQDPPEAP